jgi:hypothetical protein
MLKKHQYPFIPTPFREVGTVFIETGIRPRGEKYVKCSKFSNTTESREPGNPDKGVTGGNSRKV